MTPCYHLQDHMCHCCTGWFLCLDFSLVLSSAGLPYYLLSFIDLPTCAVAKCSACVSVVYYSFISPFLYCRGKTDQYLKEYLTTLPTKPKRTHRSASRLRRHRTQSKEATTTTTITSSHPSQPTSSRSGSPTIHHRHVNREPGEEMVAPGRVENCFAVPLLCYHFLMVAVSNRTHMLSSPQSPSRSRYSMYVRVCASTYVYSCMSVYVNGCMCILVWGPDDWHSAVSLAKCIYQT